MRSVVNENGTGGSSPRSVLNAEKSMLRRSSRGGVPVLSRPHLNPMRLDRLGEIARRRLACAP